MLSCALAVSAPGCGQEICGPGAAPVDGVSATVDGETVTYGNFTSSPNNDCTPPGSALTSLTLDGKQLAPEPSIALGITLCVPRPDEIDTGPVILGDPDTLQLIDVFAELADGCLVQLDRSAGITGTTSFAGFCGDGSDSRGYAIEFDATVPVTRMCDGQADTLRLSGSAAVEALVF